MEAAIVDAGGRLEPGTILAIPAPRGDLAGIGARRLVEVADRIGIAGAARPLLDHVVVDGGGPDLRRVRLDPGHDGEVMVGVEVDGIVIGDGRRSHPPRRSAARSSRPARRAALFATVSAPVSRRALCCQPEVSSCSLPSVARLLFEGQRQDRPRAEEEQVFTSGSVSAWSKTRTSSIRPGKRCWSFDARLPTLLVRLHCTIVPAAVLLATWLPFWYRRRVSPSYVPARCAQYPPLPQWSTPRTARRRLRSPAAHGPRSAGAGSCRLRSCSTRIRRPPALCRRGSSPGRVGAGCA